MKPKMPPSRFVKKATPRKSEEKTESSKERAAEKKNPKAELNEKKRVQKITEDGKPKKATPSRGERGSTRESGRGSDAKREKAPVNEKKRVQKITEHGKPGSQKIVRSTIAEKAITNSYEPTEKGQSDVPDMLKGKGEKNVKFKTGGATPDTRYSDAKTPHDHARIQAERDAETMTKYGEIASDKIRHGNVKKHLADKVAKLRSVLGGSM